MAGVRYYSSVNETEYSLKHGVPQSLRVWTRMPLLSVLSAQSFVLKKKDHGKNRNAEEGQAEDVKCPRMSGNPNPRMGAALTEGRRKWVNADKRSARGPCWQCK